MYPSVARITTSARRVPAGVSTAPGRIRVAGVRWQTWTDEGGDLALVRQDEDVTTLVVGHEVPLERLVEFTASLR